MFTFYCTTCEAKLVVKNEALIGKILACPKCGSMVLVQNPADSPTPPHGIPTAKTAAAPNETPPHPPILRKFPDVLTNETSSGIIGPASKDHFASALFLNEEQSKPVSKADEPSLSEKEIRTRKILIGILLGLAALLILALGFLILFRKPAIPPLRQAEQIPPVAVPFEQPKPEPAKPPENDSPKMDTPNEPKAETSALPFSVPVENTEPPPRETIRITGDSLTSLEKKMPGLVDSSIPNIDIPAKLKMPILELNLDHVRLIVFVQTFSKMTGIPITLDIDEMRPFGMSADSAVNGQFKKESAENILTEVLAELNLYAVIADRQITILPKENNEKLPELVFDVSDFAENEKTKDLTPEVLAKWIQRLISPEEIVIVLPDRKLTFEKTKFPRRRFDEVRRFLEQLRIIRGLPQKTEMIGEALAPEAFGWDEVMKPMTVNFYQPVPLARIVTQLETQTKLTFLIDHQAFHRTLSPFASVKASVQCNRGTLNDALELMLNSVDSAALAYRIIDHRTLEITTAESVRQQKKMTVEVHRYQLHEEETAEEIVRSLRSAVEPETWFTADLPATLGGGDMIIDEPSGCLFVRQSQPVQRQIRLYLSTLEP